MDYIFYKIIIAQNAMLTLLIVAFLGIILGALGAIEALKALRNIFSNNQIVRNLYTLLGAAVGSYLGVFSGMELGIWLAPLIPGLGLTAGIIIGAILCAGIGLCIGTYIYKWTATPIFHQAFKAIGKVFDNRQVIWNLYILLGSVAGIHFGIASGIKFGIILLVPILPGLSLTAGMLIGAILFVGIGLFVGTYFCKFTAAIISHIVHYETNFKSGSYEIDHQSQLTPSEIPQHKNEYTTSFPDLETDKPYHPATDNQQPAPDQYPDYTSLNTSFSSRQ